MGNKIEGSSSPVVDDDFIQKLNKRLIQHMYDQCIRRPENTIAYWDKFVGDYYDTYAVERWCFTSCSDMYDYIGEREGDTLLMRQCNICGLSSNQNYEANTDILPQALKIKWESGLTDEWIYFLDTPEARKTKAENEPKAEWCIKWLSKYMVFRGRPEFRILDDGNVIIKYGKVLRRSVYKQQFTVFHDGTLSLTFTKEMKILSWDFCGQKAGFYTTPNIRFGTLPTHVSEIESRREQIMIQAQSQINYMGLPLPYCYRFQMADHIDSINAGIMGSMVQKKVRTGKPPPVIVKRTQAVKPAQEEATESQRMVAASAANNAEGALEFLDRVKTRFDGSAVYRELLDNLQALGRGEVCGKEALTKVHMLFGRRHPDLVTEYEILYSKPATVGLDGM